MSPRSTTTGPSPSDGEREPAVGTYADPVPGSGANDARRSKYLQKITTIPGTSLTMPRRLPDPPQGFRISSVPRLGPTLSLPLAWACLPVLASALALGCGIQTDPPTEEEVGSTHALVSVERSETADGVSSRAEALAGFLNVPELVDADSVMNLVGLGLELPEAGTCVVGSELSPAGPLTETARVEFLEAGDVSLEVAGAHERLAPYNFPTVTDSISGVLYTTRDRAADPLPSSSRYTVTADGLGIQVSQDAPRTLEGVTLSGVPLFEAGSINTATPLDLTWNVGAAGDLVYVELMGSKTSNRSICSFADELGAGSVPTEGFEAGEVGRVLVHRLRTHSFRVLEQPAHGQLRFDFAMTRSVTFQ